MKHFETVNLTVFTFIATMPTMFNVMDVAVKKQSATLYANYYYYY